MMNDQTSDDQAGSNRDSQGRLLPGHTLKGRRQGSLDRIKAVEDGIKLKIRKAGYKGRKAIVEWISGLPDKELAQLYGRCLPKKIDIESGEGKMTWAEMIEKLQASKREREEREQREQKEQ